MKKSIQVFIITATLFTSLISSAMTEIEEQEFRELTAELSLQKRGKLVTLNVLSMFVSCPSGAILTSFSAVADTLPVATMASDYAFEKATTEEFQKIIEAHDEKSSVIASKFGGIIAVIIDLFQTPIDLSDGVIEDGDYTKPFQHMREAYAATSWTAQAAFGESGYCVDQFERLGILLNLK